MGLCFSKKWREKPPAAAPPGVGEAEAGVNGKKASWKVVDEKAKRTPQPKRAAAATTKAEEPATAADKKAVLAVKSKAGGEGEAKKKVVVTTVPVRTSSCTKEEVDAILIQCGRLSRSSSGSAGHRRHSGSKRSFDFDQERRTGCGGADDQDSDWERQGVPVSRPSPHRSSPQRKRSGSQERSSGSGSRRASRSPGRRADGAPSAASASSGGGGERPKQPPGKMVSVPATAREKGRAPSPAAASGKRCASPRSSSPARLAAGNEKAGGGQTAGPTPSLSRSSSRKNEQSPYRRSPMAEIDENSLHANNNNNTKPHKKPMENATPAAPQKAAKEKPDIVKVATVAASEARAPSSTTATSTATESVVNPRSGSRSHRSSRDFDQNPNSYAVQLLEDIQNYHHQQQSTSPFAATAATLPSFSLPACVSKACSILDAVADLNSTSSENGASEPGRASLGAEPSVPRYASARDIRGEQEPQESAGSNSVSGHPWTPSWEPNSVESTQRTSRSTNVDEVVEQERGHGGRSPLSSRGSRPRQSKQRPAQPEPSGRSRGGGAGTAAAGAGNNVHRGSVASRRSGVRVVSASSQ